MEKRTPVDKHSQTNPAWNYTMKYSISEPWLQHHGTMVVIKLYCKRKLGDRYIGEVHQSLKQLFDYAYPMGGSAVVHFPVQMGSAESQGQLCFSYRFGDKVAIEKLMLAESIASCLLTSPHGATWQIQLSTLPLYLRDNCTHYCSNHFHLVRCVYIAC